MSETNGSHSELHALQLESEWYVCGSALMEPSLLDSIAAIVKPEYFFNDSCGRIFAELVKLSERGAAIDIFTLGEALGYRNYPKRNDDWGAAFEKLQGIPHTVNVLYHAGKIRERWYLRTASAVGHRFLIECDKLAPQESGEDVVSGAIAELIALESKNAATRLMDGEFLGQSTLSYMKDRREGQIMGISTGYLDLDEMTNGLEPGQVIVLGGRPGSGKSALAANITKHLLFHLGSSVLFCSMEMNHKSIMNRLVSCMASIDGKKLRRPRFMSQGEWLQYQAALAQLESTGLFIDDSPNQTLAQITANARRCKHKNKIDMIVVDYLQLIDAQPKKGEGRPDQVARISRRLKTLAGELDVVILALAQLNRSVESREDKKPRLADFKESGAIEQDADIALLLHRPDLYDPQEKPGLVEVITAKNRDGETGSIDLVFEKHFSRFLNKAREEIIPQPARNDRAF